jgi:CPA2 family monovalent cation:H+ antiporter-2
VLAFAGGFVANAEIARELAEIGVILLMFGVGIHFSLRDCSQSEGLRRHGANT